MRTRNYVVVTEEHDTLDITALVDKASLGKGNAVPEATATRNASRWVSAAAAGIPARAAPPMPWAPREPEPFTMPAAPVGSSSADDGHVKQA